MDGRGRALGDILNQPNAYTPESRETDYFVASPPPLAAPAVASTSSAIASTSAAVAAPRTTGKCSQCGEKNPAAFPIRLATLEPFLVCIKHHWYWTAAVKAKTWAPERVSKFSEVVDYIKDGNGEAKSWMVEGKEEEHETMLETVSTLGNWIVTPVRHRKSRAVAGSPPPPVLSHRFELPDVEAAQSSNPNFQLDFTHHPNVGRFIITIKPQVGPVVKRPGVWRNNKLAPPRVKKDPSTGKVPSKRASSTNENSPPIKKPRMTQKRAKELEKEAQEARRANEKKVDDPQTMESDLDRLRKAVSTHNETTDTHLNSQNLEQLLHVAAAVFLSDGTHPASSRDLANLLADKRSPLPVLASQITPQKRPGNHHDDISPGSQFDELDSSEEGDDETFRGRGRSEDIEEEEELSEDETDDEDDGWLTGLVRGELGARSTDEELEDGEEYAW